MPDESDPPRKFYDLKPKEFERVNSPPRDSTTNGETPANAPNTANQRIDVRDLIRHGTAGVPLLSANAPANRSNEVHDILRDNLARADAAGLNNVKPRKRRSRRRRDYIITMLVGNGVLVAGTFIMPIFGIVGLIMFNLGYTWFTWFVMDDY